MAPYLNLGNKERFLGKDNTWVLVLTMSKNWANFPEYWRDEFCDIFNEVVIWQVKIIFKRAI